LQQSQTERGGRPEACQDDRGPGRESGHPLAKAHEVLFPEHRVFRTNLAGREIVVETGKIAKQAGGSAWVRYGDTLVLVTATMSDEPREGVDFFPLTVDYEERQYAAGRIPGNFFRREGRPTEKAILAARLTDRPIRPLFPQGFRNDVQIICTVMSVDYDNAPEFCGLLGASIALCTSDIPFDTPVGAVYVGRVDGELVINPTSEQSDETDFEILVAGTRDAVLMVEAKAKQIPERTVLEAIEVGHGYIKDLVSFQEHIVQEIGRPKREVTLYTPSAEVEREVESFARGRIQKAIRIEGKLEREEALDEIERAAQEALAERLPEQEGEISAALRKVTKEEFRSRIIHEGRRPDDRRPDEIRPIYCEVGPLPRAHGSALFTRGQTQVVTVATLGSVGDVQLLDSLEDEEFKRFIHHYNFPPYSVGETRPLRGPRRRDIGHGALAEKALETVIPEEVEFPYTIRLVSEVVESNGSTSMASVCGSTLALMDAGVPISEPVAGVAMGLVMEGDRVCILSDIQGMEDALGDMDFKVAGTKNGITALQMDIKVQGITTAILEQALEQARKGRLWILDRMLQVIPEPRKELSPYAPRIIVMEIDPDRIRDVIGPGGKTINNIIAETNVAIDVEDDGRVYIASTDEEAGRKAVKMIEELTRDVVVGETYLGRVTRITNFGAFAEVLPGKEGLIHISRLDKGRVGKVEDVVSVGDEVLAKVIEIDSMGRINLSREAALRDGRSPDEEKRKAAGYRHNDDKERQKKEIDFRRPALKRRRRRRR